MNKLKKNSSASGKQNFIIILAAIALFSVFTVINPGFASSGMATNKPTTAAVHAKAAILTIFFFLTLTIMLSSIVQRIDRFHFRRLIRRI